MGRNYPPPPSFDRGAGPSSSSLPARPPDSFRPPSGPGGNGGRGRDGGNDGDRSRGKRGRNRDNNRKRNDRNNNNRDNNLPPRPQSPRRNNSGYSDGGFGGRNGYSGGPAPPSGDFTFRTDKPAGVNEAQMRGMDSYAPSGSSRSNDRDHYRNRDRAPPSGPRGHQNRSQRDRRGGRGGYGGGNYRGGGWRPRFWASDRPFLHEAQGSVTQDFVRGKQGTTYLDVDDLSNSDEAEMDISGDDKEENTTGGAAADAQGADQPPKKRARTAKPAEPPAAPKWSNPDPYTSLPAGEPSQQKKRDVVQLIRKARMQNELSANTPADIEEFISCDVDSDDNEDGPANQAGNDDDGDDDFIIIDDDSSDAGSGRNAASGGKPSNSDKKGRNGLPGSQQQQQSHVPPPGAPKGPRASKNNTSNASANDPSDSISTSASLSKSAGKKKKGAAAAAAAAAEPPVELNPPRKRTYDDQLIPLQLPDHAKLKKVTKMPTGGSIVRDWQAMGDSDSTPWLEDYSSTTHMGTWLHKEIIDFFRFVRPRNFERRVRQDLVDDLNKLVRKRYNNGHIYCFGSFMSELYLPDGDMDMCMCSSQFLNDRPPVFDKKSHLYKFGNFLVNSGKAKHERLERITKAKVPLVKYIDVPTGLKVDISFENMNGVVAIKTFDQWKKEYPAMPVLVTVIKQFLTMRGLNEPVNGGIGGFSMICLVVSMLQLMPAVQASDMDSPSYYGDLLMHFFDLYGRKFNYTELAIQMSPPRYVTKSQLRNVLYKNYDRLSIIDPNNDANDISGGSKNTASIMRAFADAHDMLQERMNQVASMPPEKRRGQSILGVILEGNYQTYHEHRNYLRYRYEQDYNRSPPPEEI